VVASCSSSNAYVEAGADAVTPVSTGAAVSGSFVVVVVVAVAVSGIGTFCQSSPASTISAISSPTATSGVLSGF